jgi:predicted transcriptional regulator
VDYKCIAREVGRSPTTVRKWCPRITELSGYTFTTKSIYQGRSKAPLKKYVFSDDDLVKFKELAKLLTETNDFNYSVYEVYGNLKAKRERDLRKDIDDLDDYCLYKFESLENKIKSLETNNQLLSNKIATLEQFNSRLEKIEIGLRKRNIGDLLNDKN